ncbi:hypothetical protein ED733_001843 [Metarhizium rileyi]|uniref:Uncharacterized protein n=1 Tax=Metarhizium rileyi (strain RCEF 4871) TaxID=1649241 RepID=A0A5C6GAT8_METRR|nr:hypothetical protein ED733_001843 [Metarhizium rileyi]
MSSNADNATSSTASQGGREATLLLVSQDGLNVYGFALEDKKTREQEVYWPKTNNRNGFENPWKLVRYEGPLPGNFTFERICDFVEVGEGTFSEGLATAQIVPNRGHVGCLTCPLFIKYIWSHLFRIGAIDGPQHKAGYDMLMAKPDPANHIYSSDEYNPYKEFTGQ